MAKQEYYSKRSEQQKTGFLSNNSAMLLLCRDALEGIEMEYWFGVDYTSFI